MAFFYFCPHTFHQRYNFVKKNGTHSISALITITKKSAAAFKFPGLSEDEIGQKYRWF